MGVWDSVKIAWSQEASMSGPEGEVFNAFEFGTFVVRGEYENGEVRIAMFPRGTAIEHRDYPHTEEGRRAAIKLLDGETEALAITGFHA